MPAPRPPFSIAFRLMRMCCVVYRGKEDKKRKAEEVADSESEGQKEKEGEVGKKAKKVTTRAE